MTRTLLTPLYRAAPIRKVETLADVVGLDVTELRSLAGRATTLYRPVTKIKRDGTPRLCHDAHDPLKRIHGRIKNRILDLVRYPPYLQGGIHDPLGPRDYKSNAQIHARSRVIFTTDVQDFFPSITHDHIRKVWETVFRFSPEIALVLADLTVRNGALPQGARTSTHLANLVFYQHEPALYQKLNSTGIRYSRFVDDIVWSSKRDLSQHELEEGIRLTYGMLNAYGFKPKRAKQDIFLAGCRMEVNNLVTNSHPAIRKEDRSAIRAAVHQFTLGIRDGLIVGNPLPGYASLHGRVMTLVRFHPKSGGKLLAQLKDAVDPI